MMSQETRARERTHCSNARHDCADVAFTEYMRALAIIAQSSAPSRSGSDVGQPLPDPETARLLQHRRTERDIRQREPAMPEQDRFIVVLAARLEPRHDLSQLRVQRLLAQLARF